MHPDVKEILFNEEQIAARVAELGRQISEDYAGEEVIVVCVLNGAMPFTVTVCPPYLSQSLHIQFSFIYSQYKNASK